MLRSRLDIVALEQSSQRRPPCLNCPKRMVPHLAVSDLMCPCTKNSVTWIPMPAILPITVRPVGKPIAINTVAEIPVSDISWVTRDAVGGNVRIIEVAVPDSTRNLCDPSMRGAQWGHGGCGRDNRGQRCGGNSLQIWRHIAPLLLNAGGIRTTVTGCFLNLKKPTTSPAGIVTFVKLSRFSTQFGSAMSPKPGFLTL